MSETWWLYVDESGNFAKTTDHVVVAGLLIKEQATAAGQATLKVTLHGAAPHVPWPLHASRIKIPIMHALWARQKGPKHCSTQLAATSASALETLTEYEEARLRRVETAFIKRRQPRWNDLTELDTTLARVAPHIYVTLSDIAAEVLANIRHVLRTLAQHWLKNDEALVVCCSEPLPGEAAPPSGIGDRYLIMLETMLERLRDFAGWGGGEHTINVRVLRRDVRDPALGMATSLHVRHLQQIVRNLTSSNQVSRHDSVDRVSLKPIDTPSFDEAAHPGFILADLIANLLRRAMFNSGNLVRVNMGAKRMIAFPLLCGIASMPTIVATGALRRCVARARSTGSATNWNGQAALLNDDGLCLWAREQAVRWIEAFTQ